MLIYDCLEFIPSFPVNLFHPSEPLHVFLDVLETQEQRMLSLVGGNIYAFFLKLEAPFTAAEHATNPVAAEETEGVATAQRAAGS